MQPKNVKMKLVGFAQVSSKPARPELPLDGPLTIFKENHIFLNLIAPLGVSKIHFLNRLVRIPEYVPTSKEVPSGDTLICDCLENLPSQNEGNSPRPTSSTAIVPYLNKLVAVLSDPKYQSDAKTYLMDNWNHGFLYALTMCLLHEEDLVVEEALYCLATICCICGHKLDGLLESLQAAMLNKLAEVMEPVSLYMEEFHVAAAKHADEEIVAARKFPFHFPKFHTHPKYTRNGSFSHYRLTSLMSYVWTFLWHYTDPTQLVTSFCELIPPLTEMARRPCYNVLFAWAQALPPPKENPNPEEDDSWNNFIRFTYNRLLQCLPEKNQKNFALLRTILAHIRQLYPQIRFQTIENYIMELEHRGVSAATSKLTMTSFQSSRESANTQLRSQISRMSNKSQGNETLKQAIPRSSLQ